MNTLSARLNRGYKVYHALIYLSIIAAVGELAYAVVNQSALPPYLETIGLKAQAGVVIGMFLVVEAIFKSPMGSLGDRLGRRPLIVGGALVSCVTAFMMTMIHSLGGLLVLRAIDGIAAAAIWPTMIAAISGSVGSDKRTTALNAMTVSYIIGIALGPLLGGYANDVTGSKLTSFYVVSFLFLATALIAFFLTPHRSKEEMETHHGVEERGFRLSDILLGIKSVPDMMVLAFISFFSIGLLIPIVKYFAMDELKMTETGFGTLILPVAGAVAVASLFAGRLGDRWGKARSVRLGIAISAVGMWLISMSNVSWQLMIAGMLLGIGFVISMPSWLALVADMAAPRCRGTVIGALGTSQGIGAVIGAVLGSYLYEKVTFGWLGIHLSSHYSPFIISAVGLTIAFILVMIYVRDNDVRKIGWGNK